jgi:hypothetical protein
VRRTDSIEKLVKKLRYQASTEARDRILGNVLGAVDGFERRKSGTVAPDIRRAIMKSWIPQLAAAVVILITLVLLITFVDKLLAPAYAITDLPRLFEEAKVIHVQGWEYFPGHRMADGTKISPQEIDTWIDLENGRLRHRYTAFTGSWRERENGRLRDKYAVFIQYSDSVKIVTREMIISGEYRLDLNHTEKNATFFRISDYQKMFSAHHIWQVMALDTLGEVEQLGNFKRIGWEEIDGVKYDIWLGQVVCSVTGLANRFKFWIRPDTKELVRSQSWVRANGAEWQLQCDYHISRNIDIAEGTFATQVPEGYVAQNSKRQANRLLPPHDFSGSIVGYQIGEYNLLLQTAVSFTMNDGSVILGWSSVDRKSNTPLNVLFEGLRFGGAVPKLAVEICGLKAVGTSTDVIYTGHHLACTTQADRSVEFTEWSLFVPDGRPPWSVKRLGYDVIYRFNLEPEPPWSITLKVPHGLLIKSTKEFNKWVLCAMAELSDDGKAPEHVTYENVVRLAEQIRN